MTVRIIGLGNRFRRDDGIGPALVAHLLPDLPAGAEAMTCLCEPATLVEALRGPDSAILIDAAAPRGTPGRVTRLDATTELPGQETAASTHGFSLAEVLGLARALGTAPRRVIVYAVEGADFGHGDGLSSEVADALPALAEAVRAEIAAQLQAALQTESPSHA